MVITCFKDGWNVQETTTDRGCVYEYQRMTTLTGAAQDIDLSVPFPFELNRIEYYSNDATAKTFTERIFSGNANTVSYAQILSVAADVNLSILIIPTGSEIVYTQAPIRLRTAITASTAGKTLTKKIVLRRLS